MYKSMGDGFRTIIAQDGVKGLALVSNHKNSNAVPIASPAVNKQLSQNIQYI